jgi:two-component system, NtrC family, response regulator AlgB
MNILVVDDEANLRRTIRVALESFGHHVAEAASQVQAIQQIEQFQPDLVLLDLRLGRESGLDVLNSLHKVSPGLGVVVITAHATIETAVEAMRRGALDYLPKPFTPDQLAEIVNRWRSRISSENDGDSVILDSTEPSMSHAIDTVFPVAASDATILLRGESGTGKGVLAKAIHARSRRQTGPFVTVHCPSLSSELLESELFGHAKGSFTGAIRTTEGKVAAAEGGTLFLDEIGDLPLPLQPKMLRFVQDRKYERVGETKDRTGDVRIIAATNRNLEQEVAAGRFREDLLYRLNVIEVTVPPLRERRGDLLALAHHLLNQFATQSSKDITDFAPLATEQLLRHRWPGNVRELRNVIERAVLLCKEKVIDVKDLPASVTGSPQAAAKVVIGEEVPIDQVEVEHIRRVLANSATLEDAARTLGIDPSTLYRKRKRYGL